MNDHSHALRGNASREALRPRLRDAEHHGLHVHSETYDRSYALRGNASWDAPRPLLRDAERHGHDQIPGGKLDQDLAGVSTM
ncbi:hypothetical protein PS634_00757 [Pseudomonas fluorescens]|nr:hypothetical protein PS634_00757 [Pseudomonas fluorescens]